MNTTENPEISDAELQKKMETRQALQMKGCLISIVAVFFVMLISFEIIDFKLDSELGACRATSTEFNECSRDLGVAPEQLRLSLGTTDREIHVTWSTQNPVHSPELVYKKVGYFNWAKVIQAHPTEIILDDKDTHETAQRNQTKVFTYRVKITDLEPGTSYIYWVRTKTLGIAHRPLDNNGGTLLSCTYCSKIYAIPPSKLEDDATIDLAIFGNVYTKDIKSLDLLNWKTYNGKKLDLIIQNGGSDRNAGRRSYDIEGFLRDIEQLTAHIPYQVAAGRFHSAQDFPYFDSKFTMINGSPTNHGERNNFYYSFNAGPVHFVALCTEFYFQPESADRDANIQRQFRWLEKDLQQAASVAERVKRPWIIVYGNRPMYCSSRNQSDDCSRSHNPLRVGLGASRSFALEELLYRHGVDVQFYAQDERYERLLPIYDNQVRNGTESPDDPYRNPLAPVHLISGPIDQELGDRAGKPTLGSVKQISVHGYTLLSASRCKLKFELISTGMDARALDDFTITKSRLTNFPSDSPINIDCRS